MNFKHYKINKILFGGALSMCLILFSNVTFAASTDSIISMAKSYGYDTSEIENYLNVGKKAGIDLSTTENIKNYLRNDVRNTAKATASTARAGLSLLPDSEWKREQIRNIDQIEQDSLKKIDTTVQQIGKAEQINGLMNTVGKIPAVLNLVDDIKNLGKGSPNPAQMISTLEKIGGIAGFEIPADFKQGFGMISGMSGGMEGAISTLQNVLGGKGGLTNSSVAMIPGAPAAVSKVLAETVGAGGIGSQGAGILNKGAETMKKNAEVLETNKLSGQNLCDSQQDSQSDSGSDGVPVIEQSGALLGYNKQIAKVTTQTRFISQKTCEMIEEILEIQRDLKKKEREDDPRAAQEARQAIAKEKEAFEKRMQTGRTPSENENAERSFYPTLSAYKEEEAKAIRVKVLQNIEESNIPNIIKTPLLQAFEQEVALLNDPNAAYRARVAPTFDPQILPSLKGSDYFEGLIALAEPQNNIVGQYLINRSEAQKLEAEHLLNTEKTWSTYQIPPEQVCVEEANYKNQKSCIKKEIVTPAKWVADQGSAFATTKLRMTENTDEYNEEKNSALGNGGASVTGTTAETSGQSRGEVRLPNPTEIPGEDLSNLCGLIPFGPLKEACEKILESEWGDFQGGDDVVSIQPVPLPIIKFINEGATNDLKTGLRKTKISWTSENALYCIAGNNWVSYGKEDEAALTPSIIIENNSDLGSDDNAGTMGNFEIIHPAIFRYSIYASGPERPSGTIPQNPTMSLGVTAGNLVQKITYTPNINGLSANDNIFLTLNGNTTNIPANAEDETPNQRDIVERLRNALDNEIIETKANEFSKYTKTIEGNSLILERINNEFPVRNDYSVKCYGGDNRETTQNIRVNF